MKDEKEPSQPRKDLGEASFRERDKQGPEVGQARGAEGGDCGGGQCVRQEQLKMRLEREMGARTYKAAGNQLNSLPGQRR